MLNLTSKLTFLLLVLFISPLSLAEKSWQEVTQLPQYQSLSDEEKENARNEYFYDVVAPNASSLQELNKLKDKFNADTMSPEVYKKIKETEMKRADPKIKLKFYECVLEKMEKQQVPQVFGIAVRYCEILHPNGHGDI